MSNDFMRQAIALAQTKMQEGHGGPFGALIVKNGTVVATGHNQVTSTNDPTAHAEMVAIRTACQHLQTFRLKGCELYVNCEPCPMCLAAIYWAGIKAVFYAASKEDAAAIGFADAFIAEELCKPLPLRQVTMTQILRSEALPAFRVWETWPGKIDY